LTTAPEWFTYSRTLPVPTAFSNCQGHTMKAKRTKLTAATLSAFLTFGGVTAANAGGRNGGAASNANANSNAHPRALKGGRKGHKGGRKSKKGSGGTTTPPPK
jgi:hypothetical protein